jgi:hypothetical protein
LTSDRGKTSLRRLAEAGAFAALIGVLWTVDTLTKRNLIVTRGYDFELYRLYVEQATSAVVVFLLVPAVAWWLNRFPLERERWPNAVVGHLIGTGLFAMAHYFGMIGLRYVIYTLNGRSFVFSDFWLNNLLIEYQKDLKIYFGIVAIIAAYRHFRGQAERGKPTPSSRRLVVQTGTGESVIRQDEIRVLEAARNYVTVYTADREYLMRQTLKRLEESLDSDSIVRCHRSYLVNLDYIDEIRSTDTGGYVIRMQGGREVPLSRSFRDSFRIRLAAETPAD